MRAWLCCTVLALLCLTPSRLPGRQCGFCEYDPGVGGAAGSHRFVGEPGFPPPYVNYDAFPVFHTDWRSGPCEAAHQPCGFAPSPAPADFASAMLSGFPPAAVLRLATRFPDRFDVEQDTRVVIGCGGRMVEATQLFGITGGGDEQAQPSRLLPSPFRLRHP